MGPRQRAATHTRSLTHTSGLTGVHAHAHLDAHTAIYIKIHMYTHRFPRRLTHTPVPHPTCTHMHLHYTYCGARRLRDTTGAHTNVPPTSPHARRRRLTDTAPSPPPLPSPSWLQRSLPGRSHWVPLEAVPLTVTPPNLFHPVEGQTVAVLVRDCSHTA